MARDIVYDARKLDELVLYVSQKSADDPFYGKTKLNKILFFADFHAFRLQGVPVTGAAYQHLEQGPAPHQMLPCLNRLQSSGRLHFDRIPTPVGIRHQPVADDKPDLSAFSAPEIAIVDVVLHMLRRYNNTQVSELSHQHMGWRLTELNQEIPYGAALLDVDDQLSEEELAWLANVEAEHDLVRST